MIKELQIKDRVIRGKGSFMFTKKADELYQETDVNGNKTDGVSSIYNDLIMGNEYGIIKFWHCAASTVPSLEVSENEIIEAVQAIADEQGLEPLFKGALEVFTTGFYKEKMKKQELMMTLAVKNEKDPEKREEMESQIAMMKEIATAALS